MFKPEYYPIRSSLKFYAFILFMLFALESRPQGCSDPGFCSIQSMNPAGIADTLKDRNNTFHAGFTFGMSQHEILVFTPFVEYTRLLGRNFSFSGKVNFGLLSGELANTIGPSDFYLSMSYNFLGHFFVTGGVKVPFNDGNKKKEGMPLPMNYQLSLGTTDILLGVGYKIKRFSFTAGYQQPVTQNNNQFLATDYSVNSRELKYYSTRNYYKTADVMLRLSFIAVHSKKITLITGLVPIYHIQNDTYQEPDGNRVTLSGSQGLTLNLNVILQYHIAKSQFLELSVGAPAISRKVRPDGLSKFAIGFGYNISF
ncbi:MAG: hypothetical protein Q8M08_14040 [Bacteroidales bacterium]|nr:hypothetical protein [Bacteroidales bacterium]